MGLFLMKFNLLEIVMNVLKAVFAMLVRFRYPVSLPQDIACCLGIQMQNSVRFKELLDALTSGAQTPTKLIKFMPRDMAERAFRNALRKERFPQSSLYSFYFNEGWLEFELQFDEQSKLRRLYLHHKLLSYPSGYELPLATKPGLTESSDSLYIA
jgi:hypothetical protein